MRTPLIIRPPEGLTAMDRSPVRTVTRSVMLSSPIEAVTLYMAGCEGLHNSGFSIVKGTDTAFPSIRAFRLRENTTFPAAFSMSTRSEQELWSSEVICTSTSPSARSPSTDRVCTSTPSDPK